MDAPESDQYVTYSLSTVHDIQQSIISHEEVCEPSDGVLEAAEILCEKSSSDDEVVYPIYIKQEETPQYTSGDDESMAVEALRQLGGMYTFEDRRSANLEEISVLKVAIPENNANSQETIDDDPLATAPSSPKNFVKFSCSTCGENFERKLDLNNHVVCHQVDRPHACRTCGNLFRSKASLQTHMTQVHNQEKLHKCTICGADFQRPSSLSNHMKIHTYVAGRALISQGQETTFSDSATTTISTQPVQQFEVTQVNWQNYSFQSDQGTQDKIDLQEFTVLPNGEVAQFEYLPEGNQTYNLNLGTLTSSETLVKILPKTFVVESEKTFTCSQCGVGFSRATALASHEKVHLTKPWAMPIECEFCDKQFQDSEHLAAHQTTCAKKLMLNNGDNPNGKWSKHACAECGKKFTTKQKMFRHQWIHRKKTHSCEVCGSQFEKQNQLDEHRLAAHPGDSPFTCTECGKSFVSRQGLWEHSRTHAGSPAHFHCDTCSKTFSSRQGYLIHHRTHTGERPYGCKFCWKAFRDGGTLRKHERIHTGERPHVCPLCSRAFNQKVVLREHVRWVHAAGKNETEAAGPPFPCPLCGAMNQDRDELCAHIVKHSDQMIAEAKAKTGQVDGRTKKIAIKGRGKVKREKGSEVGGDCEVGEANEVDMGGVSDEMGGASEVGMVCDDMGGASEVGGVCEEMGGVSEVRVVSEMGMVSEMDGVSEMGVVNRIDVVNGVEQETFLIVANEGEGKEVNIQGLRLQFVEDGRGGDLDGDSLPVLAIRSEGEADFGGEIERIEEGVYQESEEEDKEVELVCGICGDEFVEKGMLMEHVKMHI